VPHLQGWAASRLSRPSPSETGGVLSEWTETHDGVRNIFEPKSLNTLEEAGTFLEPAETTREGLGDRGEGL